MCVDSHMELQVVVVVVCSLSGEGGGFYGAWWWWSSRTNCAPHNAVWRAAALAEGERKDDAGLFSPDLETDQSRLQEAALLGKARPPSRRGWPAAASVALISVATCKLQQFAHEMLANRLLLLAAIFRVQRPPRRRHRENCSSNRHHLSSILLAASPFLFNFTTEEYN